MSVAANRLDKQTISRRTKEITKVLFRTCLLIGLGFVILYPMLYMLAIGFRDVRDMFDNSVVWVSKHFTVDNLKYAYTSMNYPVTLANTAILSLICSALSMASTAITGYGFARFRFRGRNLLFILVLVTIIVPPQTYIMPLYVNCRYFDWFGITAIITLFTEQPVYTNLIGSRFSMILPAVFSSGIRSGLFIYIFRQFFRGLPKELEEAGAIDGCGFIRSFLRIMVPSAKPAFVTVFLLSMVWYWNDYQFSGMLLSNVRSLTVALMSIESLMISASNTLPQVEGIIVVQQAGCLLVVFPLVLLFAALQKQFTQSIERTGIVG